MKLCALVLLAGTAALAAPAAVSTSLTAKAAAVAPWLPATPTSSGPSITNRAAWQALAAVPSFKDYIPTAEKLLKKPFPESPDDLFLDFSVTGNRKRWEGVSSDRRSRIAKLALAECLEDRWRFIPAFEQVVRQLCAEKTWVMPAHDRGLQNFKGKAIDIDLGAAMLAGDLATAYHVLGPKLSPACRGLILTNVTDRVLTPYREMVDGTRKANWWVRGDNNWNAVCHAGVVLSALAVLPSREERALYVAAADENIRPFLGGFTDDGYCSEGVGYWSYGFGNFVVLAEAVRRATGGKIDWMDSEKVQLISAYSRRIEIVNGICPAFADSGVFSRPDARLSNWLARRFPNGGPLPSILDVVSPNGSLPDMMFYNFPVRTPARPMSEAIRSEPATRSWFPEAGILICRMPGGSTARFGAGMKGGHNDEHHNHNDVGSYAVVVGRTPVLCDPGAEVYTARTFSDKRYDSKLLSSFGHPVAVVAGELQQPGREGRGKVLATAFSATNDQFKIDYASCYNTPALESLTRTFTFDRSGAGSFAVSDEVAFKTPQTFGTAVVTPGTWKKLSDTSLECSFQGETVRVDIQADPPTIVLKDEKIEEDSSSRITPTRIGIDFASPVTRGSIRILATPVAKPAT